MTPHFLCPQDEDNQRYRTFTYTTKGSFASLLSPSCRKTKVETTIPTGAPKKQPTNMKKAPSSAPPSSPLSGNPPKKLTSSSKKKSDTPAQTPQADYNRSSSAPVKNRDVETPPETARTGSNDVTIHHVTSGRGSGSRGLIMGMTKPVMALVGLLTVGSLGAGLWGWFTIPGLYDQIEELEAQVDRLASEVDRFAILNNQLNQTVTELEAINRDLNATASSLRSSVDDLEAENDRLNKLNDNLESIVGFLNETTVEIGKTLDDVTDYLAEQITASRVLVTQTMENTYQQTINHWDCAFRDVFRNQPFVANEDSPIGLANLPAVFDYVDDRVLSEVCADRNDFEGYVENRFGLTTLTTNQLYQGVAIYMLGLFNYYFPDPGQDGLTSEDWAAAEYSCTKVSPFAF